MMHIEFHCSARQKYLMIFAPDGLYLTQFTAKVKIYMDETNRLKCAIISLFIYSLVNFSFFVGFFPSSSSSVTCVLYGVFCVALIAGEKKNRNIVIDADILVYISA